MDKRGSITSIQNKTFVDKTVEIRQESLGTKTKISVISFIFYQRYTFLIFKDKKDEELVEFIRFVVGSVDESVTVSGGLH